MDELLRVENLNKRFPQVWANRDISLDVRRGEIHCLLGENGAGKSTFAECLYGAYRPDSGTIWLRGQELSLSSPRDAIRAGIGMVHQHFVLAPPMSVLENVIAGTPLGIVVNQRHAEDRLRGLCDAYDLDVDVHAAISELSVGQQQWVEILKALYVGVDLLILDEPTAVLTPIGTEKLFSIIDKMRQEGLSVIFITHRLEEVMAVSERVTVLRRGHVVATVDTASTSEAELARMMVGRDVVFQVERGTSEPGEPYLVIEDLRARGDRGDEALRGVSLSVRRGEILGLAGVSGNGQRELFDVIVGMRKPTTGKVLLGEQEVSGMSPRSIMDLGLTSIPEDRIAEGLVMDFRVDENMILGLHRTGRFSKWRLLDDSKMRRFTTDSIEAFKIAAYSPRQVTRILSGGNLQKVILARELSRDPSCLVANQPTRGLDVGATEYVHRQLVAQRERGAAVLLISEDLDEILDLCDRVAVMSKGRMVGVLDSGEATVERVGLMMVGVQGDRVPETA
jgi:general nucleoside transport system ATP-binding protein